VPTNRVPNGSISAGDAASIVARLAAGEVEALADLYDRHAALVYGLARRILRNDADAEDVVQEVFAQVWRTAARYDRARGSVIGWLLVMTRTRALDKLRRRQARPDSNPSALPETLHAGDTSPHDVMISAEQAGVVREALNNLPPPQRTALELAYYEGLTQTEIAARLSEPLGTVKTRMRTALETLRARLRQ
jgi:RNA polymerase sigma-70 factor (ECF subfamily)